MNTAPRMTTAAAATRRCARRWSAGTTARRERPDAHGRCGSGRRRHQGGAPGAGVDARRARRTGAPRPAGLNALGELKDPFWKFGSEVASQGTMVHPYVLAALALVAGVVFAVASVQRRSWRLAAVAAVAVAPVGFTFSRAGLLGLAGALVCLGTGLLTAERSRYIPALVGLCL